MHALKYSCLMALVLLSSYSYADVYDKSYWMDFASNTQQLSSQEIDLLNQQITELNPSLYDIFDFYPKVSKEFVIEKGNINIWGTNSREMYLANPDNLPTKSSCKIKKNFNNKKAHFWLSEADSTQWSKYNPIKQTLEKRQAFFDNLNTNVKVQFGLTTQRTNLISAPLSANLHNNDPCIQANSADPIYYASANRLIETGVYLGEPVAIFGQSVTDVFGVNYHLVAMYNYIGWMRSDHIAIGGINEVSDYAKRTPRMVVTGNYATTEWVPQNNYMVPYASELSKKMLHMGVSLPISYDYDKDNVNGQAQSYHYVIDLPVRDPKGKLILKPALVRRSQDVKNSTVAFNEKNIVKQIYKLLGERYDWGGAYTGRDCSMFTNDIYRSMGIIQPRNTSDQKRIAGIKQITFTEDMSKTQRYTLIAQLPIGTQLVLPGHIVLYLGQKNGKHYVAHDYSGTTNNGVRKPYWSIVITALEEMSDDEFIMKFETASYFSPQ